MNKKNVQKGLGLFTALFFFSVSHAESKQAPVYADTPPTTAAKSVTAAGPTATTKPTTTTEPTATTTEPAATTTESTTTTDASAETTVQDDLPPPVDQKDPLEGFNRAIFTFNDKLDIYLLKPIATVYNKIMPKPLNQGIHNVYFNISTIPTIANDVLQANFYQATNDLWRLGINTTVGIGGLFDIAERMKLQPYSNDFGLTFARWGWSNSTYLVLPFFGPYTIRDGLGMPVDYFAFSIYPYINPPSLRYEIYGLGVIDRRAQLLKFQDVMEEAALDKYVFMRNAYMQRRTYQIEQNEHRSCCDQKENAESVEPVLAPEENYD